ncbi:MAG: thioredoxin fold domain-containing protein [Candidatus Krumholzibacteriota bacterium]|nr:thioredoxin fold domain-containing protein [Candidatus Krumholzibacteriota bacterium]
MRRRSTGIIAIATALALLAAAGAAQTFFDADGELVETSAVLSLSAFHPGSRGMLAVTATILDGWHINANEPLDEYLIPTVLEIEAPPGIAIKRFLYPEPERMRLEISDGDMLLYHGRLVFGAEIAVDADAAPGPRELRIRLRYQGCNNATCREPAEASVVLALRVACPEETVALVSPDLFAAPPFAGPTAGGGGDAFGGMVAERGLLLAFVFIFLGGLALNLTPCIYPLIPITVSYFGGQSGGRTSRTFLLALVYVLGMSITYSVLGVVAAMTGSLFGSALQNPWVILFIAAVLLGLALSMFGVWELRMPAFLTRRTGRARQGWPGALFMGLTVGVLAAPCIGPFVLGLLTWVGEMGNPVLGFLMFFTLAWGMGLPFLVLGTVSGSINRLPRSGNWMIWIRKVFGFILIAMAVYFARHFLPGRLAGLAYVAIAASAGIWLGWLDRTGETARGFVLLRRAVGVLAIALAAGLVLWPGGPVRPADTAGIGWTPFEERLLERAAADGEPVLVDFSADWCIPCHELEHATFADAGVIALAAKTVALKVDLTRPSARETELKKRFGVRGVPTIIFIDRAGEEATALRVTGFVDAAEFRRRLEAITR